MRRLTEKLYLRLLRIEGGYAALTCLVFFATLPMSFGQGFHMLVPGLLSVISLVAAVALFIPRLTPPWLTHPAGVKAGTATLVFLGLMPLLMMMTTFSAILAFAIPEPTSQTVAVSLAGLHFLLFGVLWWLAVILLVVPGDKSSEASGPAPMDLQDPYAA